MRKYFLITLLLASFFASGQNVDLLPTSVLPLDTASWTMLRQPAATSLRKASLNRIFLTGKNYYDALYRPISYVPSWASITGKPNFDSLYWKTADTTTIQSDVLIQGDYRVDYKNLDGLGWEFINGSEINTGGIGHTGFSSSTEYNLGFATLYQSAGLNNVNGFTVYSEVTGGIVPRVSNYTLGFDFSYLGTNSFYGHKLINKTILASSIEANQNKHIIAKRFKRVSGPNFDDLVINIGYINDTGEEGFGVYHYPNVSTTDANVGESVNESNGLFKVTPIAIETGPLSAGGPPGLVFRSGGGGLQPLISYQLGTGLAISGSNINVTNGNPSGGTTNQVLTKNSGTDYDYSWQTPSGGGSGTVNSGNQYRLGYYASTGTAISEAAAITANRALISDANGVPTHSSVTATELGYVSGVTSALQTQLNAKAPTASPTFTGTPVFPASVTIAANVFARSGAHDLTLTTTGTTNVTLPTSGTLAISSAAQTFTGTQTFSPTATVAGINLGSYAGNPSSLNNYDVWFNSSLLAFGIKMAATNYYVPHLATTDAVSGRISFVASSSGRNSTNANLLYNGTQVNVPSLVIGSTGSIPANTSLYVPSSTNPVVLNGRIKKRTGDSGSDLYRGEDEYPVATGSGSTGNTDYNLFLSDAITNSTVTVEVIITAVSSDGLKSYAKKMYATFRKPGTSDMVQVGSTVDVYEHSNDLTSPSSSVSVSSDNMRVAWDSGTGAPTLQWTHKIKIIMQSTW